MKKKEFNCPAELTVFLMGGKWKSIIIYNLRKAGRRFGTLQRMSPGISRATLTKELKFLENYGLVKREQIGKDKTLGVEYSLTEKGQSLKPVLYAMLKWGIANQKDYISGKFGMDTFSS